MPRKTPFRPYRRLSVTKLAELLSEVSGQQVTAEMIQADLAAGAPTNRDGTVSLVRYAAWLVAQGTRGKRLDANGAEQPPNTRSPAAGAHRAAGLAIQANCRGG